MGTTAPMGCAPAQEVASSGVEVQEVIDEDGGIRCVAYAATTFTCNTEPRSGNCTSSSKFEAAMAA
jgi:hypothetical protein